MDSLAQGGQETMLKLVDTVRLGDEKEVKMETPRTLALRLLAGMVTVLPISTSVYYSVGDAVGYFVEYLLYLSG